MMNLLRLQLFKPVAAAIVALVFSLLLVSLPAMTKLDTAKVLAQKTLVQDLHAEEHQESLNQNDTSAMGIESSFHTSKSKLKASRAIVDNLANLEAVLNIIANTTEIWGISSVGNFFFAAIGAFVLKRMKLGGIMIALCPVLLTYGLAAPGIINWIAVSARDAQFEAATGVLAVVSALVLVVLLMGVGFTPALIAAKRDHPHKWVIFGMTFISWLIPFGWPALFTWSLVKGKTSESEGAPV